MQHAVAVQVADLAPPQLEGELAALPGPASTPGQDVTSSVICSLAVCVLVIASPGRSMPRTTTSSELEVKARLILFMAMADLLTIGEVSRRSGVASSALRFYEERGLITSERAGSGHRRYPRPVLRRIAFIVFAQRVGLTLDEIGAELAKLPPDRAPTRARLVAPLAAGPRGSTSGSPSSSGSSPA